MTNILPTPFAAVLLAGGRSTRMGRDKAGLIIGSQPLWELQLAKLRALDPAELFISGPPDGPYAGAGVETVTDPVPGLGPLAGIVATMQRTTAPLLLVLAIDLPRISRELLATLVAAARQCGCGVVPQCDGRLEPLAAIYPLGGLALAEALLHTGDRSLQTFIRRLIAAQLASTWPLAPPHLGEFQNVNTPGDL